jgi:CheY-like chemotaxis protein
MNATILLVEDDEDSRAIYGTVLRHAGFRVVEACDGEAALRSVGTERPDLVVMDAGLPVVDGWDATRSIKNDPATATLPVLLLTVHGQDSDVERARTVGCDAYVLKPADPAMLATMVGRMLAEARARG